MSGVNLPAISSNVPGVTPSQVAESQLFWDWLQRAQAGGIRVEQVTVWAAHRFGSSPVIRMMHLTAVAYKGDETNALPGIVFLRGDTVDMMALLRTPDRGDFVILVEQPRVAGAQACVRSNPSGMVDPGEGVRFAGLRELNEEIGDDTLTWRSPFDPEAPASDMLALVTGTHLPALVTPGASDERVAHLVTMAEVSYATIQALRRRFSSHEGEDITVVVEPLAEMLTHLAPLSGNGSIDEKTLTAALLYQQCCSVPVYR